MKDKILQNQKGGITWAFILLVVIIFSILLASGQLLNKSAVYEDESLPEQPTATP